MTATVFAPRALAAVESALAAIPARRAEIILHFRDLSELTNLNSTESTLRRKHARLADGGLADRPKRHMPSLRRIADFWELPEPPACVACGWPTPAGAWREANRWLIRAHIIDRVMDGLDKVWNFAPICNPCHRKQPIFYPGDERTALSWFDLPPRKFADST